MEKLLDRTVVRIINLISDHGLRVDNWIMDGIRIEINAALMSACLIGRTEALHQVIDHLNAIRKKKT